MGWPFEPLLYLTLSLCNWTLHLQNKWITDDWAFLQLNHWHNPLVHTDSIESDLSGRPNFYVSLSDRWPHLFKSCFNRTPLDNLIKSLEDPTSHASLFCNQRENNRLSVLLNAQMDHFLSRMIKKIIMKRADIHPDPLSRHAVH